VLYRLSVGGRKASFSVTDFAIFVAILIASSRVINFATDLRPGSSSE